MNRRVKILVILSFLFLIVLVGSYSYSKYRSDVTGQASTNVAKWNITVNGCNIVTPDTSNSACFESKVNEDDTVTIVRNFNITEFTYSNSDTANVKRDKIAPGSSGEFVLRINPQDTQVSIKYTIRSYIKDDDFALEYYIKGPNDTNRIQVPETGYVGYIIYNPANASGNHEDVITFYVDWLNDETANEKDTVIGTKSSDPKLDIPIEITFEQYNG